MSRRSANSFGLEKDVDICKDVRTTGSESNRTNLNVVERVGQFVDFLDERVGGEEDRIEQRVQGFDENVRALFED